MISSILGHVFSRKTGHWKMGKQWAPACHCGFKLAKSAKRQLDEAVIQLDGIHAIRAVCRVLHSVRTDDDWLQADGTRPFVCGIRDVGNDWLTC